MIKITIEDEHKKVTCETEAQICYEVMEEIKGLLIAYGFHPNNVDNCLDEELRSQYEK